MWYIWARTQTGEWSLRATLSDRLSAEAMAAGARERGWMVQVMFVG